MFSRTERRPGTRGWHRATGTNAVHYVMARRGRLRATAVCGARSTWDDTDDGTRSCEVCEEMAHFFAGRTTSTEEDA